MHALTSQVRQYFPAIAFFAGFIWDALTIGRGVAALDLLILSGYLIGTIPIIWWLAKKTNAQQLTEANQNNKPKESWKTRIPYLLLQFLFGSLFCALFILYFKSSSHITAIAWSVGLGALLVANEFFESVYKRFTLTWTLFGFCTILLLNFVMPYLVGSVHAFWFFSSVIVAVVVTYFLKRSISPNLGNIIPTYAVAVVIVFAYVFDVIPPVPLVKRDIQVGTNLQKFDGQYVLEQNRAPWWMFWRQGSNTIYINSGEGVYCVSSVFAPAGLKTKLYHRWQYYDKKSGWVTTSNIGFNLSGGRNNGFRGYTVKKNVAYGDWRVAVETENARTITVYSFDIQPAQGELNKVKKVF